MGVLESLRSSSDNTGMQVILVMVVIAFIGVTAIQPGERSRVVAEVNGTRIMDTQFDPAFRDAQRQEEQRLQKTLNEDERNELVGRVEQQLIERELLLQEAENLGVHVSDAEVGKMIARSFRRNGSFSESDYERYIKFNGTTKEKFQEKLREDLTAQKVLELASLGITLNDRSLRDEFVKAETKVELELVEIQPTRMQQSIEVSEADVTAWLGESDNASLVKSAYDEDFDRLYNRPEKVRFRMIRLAVEADGPNRSDLVAILNEVRKEAEGGADFAELAKTWSEDPSALQGGDTGMREVKLLAAQDAVAIDGLKVGELTKVYPTETDLRLLKIEERIDAEVDELEAVQSQIAERIIREERANDQANEARRGLLAKWGESGELPADLIEKYGLTSRTTGLIPTFRQGLVGPPQAILDWSRTADVGGVRPNAFEERGTWTLAKLVSREEPDLTEFEENKDRLREQLLLQRRQAFVGQYVKGLRDNATIVN